jgi:hypothetical protein
MSRASASDHLCVGQELKHLPRIGGALAKGEIGYQAASTVCHLSEQLGDKRQLIDEDEWLGLAQRLSIKELRYETHEARVQWDCEGFERDTEESYDLRSLHVSETMGGMYRIDGWLDPVGGAALKAAIESLSSPLGADDRRSPKQRRADAAVELVHHAMDQGTLPRRNGVRPHISVHTTIEGLKGELGAPASHLQTGMPISSKTVQRLACDCTLHRVLKADSMVVDVGRAKRTAQTAQWRGLKARHKTCAGPGCDRPLNWTSAHHLEFWAMGGGTDLPKMLPLCYYHRRLVHEGGWQVIRKGDQFQFIPPDWEVPRRARGPGFRRAA